MQAFNRLTDFEIEEKKKLIAAMTEKTIVFEDILPANRTVEEVKQQAKQLEEEKFKEVESKPHNSPEIETILKTICAKEKLNCQGEKYLCPNIKLCKRKLKKIIKQLSEQGKEGAV